MRCTLLTVVYLAMLAAGYSPPMEDSTRNVFGECILPLGMEEGKIPDDAITASSSYESKSVGPQNARIRQEKNGGAWCPKAQISSSIREYLEIDLTRNHLIAWTETQGRFGNGQGQEYAEAFFLEYWRDTKWHHYKNLKGDRVLRGNSNTYLVEKQKLDLPFVASRVRFVPYSQHPRTVCMRVEIYGCLWDQYVVRYIAPRGARNGPGGCNVEDSSYDGDTELGSDSLLVNGLGQLTDGILGELSEILSSTGSATATNWVGWSDRDTVQFLFEFQETREFENCSIHVARLPELEVEMFSRLQVWFSTNGDDYQTNPDISETIPIDGSDSGSTVFTTSIPLRSKIGRFVKLEVSFAGKWLLLSEITFHTVAGIENRSIGTYVPVDRAFGEDRNQSELWRKVSELESTMSGLNETDIYKILKDDDATMDAFPVGSLQTYVGLVSGLLTVIVLFLTCTAFLIKQRGRNKIALLQKHTALLCDSSAPGIAINPKDVKLHSSIVNGLSLIRKPIIITMATSSAATVDSANATIATAASPTSTLSASATTTTTAATTTTVNATAIANKALVETDSSDTQADHQPVRSRANSHVNQSHRTSALYEKTCQLLSDQDLILAEANASTRPPESCPEFKCKISNFARNKSTEFALSVPTVAETKKPIYQSISGKSTRKVHEGYYAATDILTIKRRELSSTVSPFTPLHIREKAGKAIVPRTLDTRNIRRISRHRLRILDMLGEGNFGLVHLCEAKGIASPDVGSGSGQNRQTVIVRSLWRGVVDSLRIDFTKDMRVLATLRDPHVARMIALVEEEPFGAVFEYGELGDLPAFLESRGTVAEKQTILSDRLNFARQIASGMKYLESVKIPHCDLAARNCIVGQNLTIKVSDHAMYCSKYDHHYYMDAYNGKIPLRWMAWDAVILSARNCRADVWSFAVTVWEIFTNCKEIPYSDLTAEQVFENCNRWYNANENENVTGNGNGLKNADEKHQPRVLPRPSGCSDDLYSIMQECWSKRPEDRPTFEEMNRYLEKLAHV
ncbi:discoidin domain-containing receptor 2-like isoform X2 [Halictus rubicundus]|uniref:discoidin domain-containing receptor 2-like isoform X2 n=1 Tax=Halictus rubicundus TaxID=77578 RepID=UPI00403630D9